MGLMVEQVRRAAEAQLAYEKAELEVQNSQSLAQLKTEMMTEVASSHVEKR